MEDKVKEILDTLHLQRWKENVINNDVNYATLKYMIINRCPELAEVIPSVGARIALQNYFFSNDLCKETKASSELSLASTSTPSVIPTLTLALAPREMFDVTVPLANEASINSDIEAPIENAIQPSLVEASSINDTQNILNTSYDDKPAKKIQTIETVDNMMLESFDLKALLQKTVTGQAIIASYHARNGLPLTCRQYLTNIIICHFFDNNINVQLNNEKLNKIADHIITLFPAERKEVYYCPPVKKKNSGNHKSVNAKGKLVNKNRNMLTFLRKYQLIPSSKSFSANSSKD